MQKIFKIVLQQLWWKNFIFKFAYDFKHYMTTRDLYYHDEVKGRGWWNMLSISDNYIVSIWILLLFAFYCMIPLFNLKMIGQIFSTRTPLYPGDFNLNILYFLTYFDLVPYSYTFILIIIIEFTNCIIWRWLNLTKTIIFEQRKKRGTKNARFVWDFLYICDFKLWDQGKNKGGKSQMSS